MWIFLYCLYRALCLKDFSIFFFKWSRPSSSLYFQIDRFRDFYESQSVLLRMNTNDTQRSILRKKNPYFKIEYYFKKITICKNNSLQTLIKTNRIFRYFFFIPTKLTFRLRKYVLTNFVITLTRESQTKLYFYWFFSLVLTVIENIFVFHLEYMHFHIGMSKVYICDIFKIHECDRRY